MMLPLVIVNPESASGGTRKAWPQIASDLRSRFGPFKNVFTEESGQATHLAKEAAQTGVTLIIACGGDGTISEAANGILASGKDVELGILPSGTGGDFRRTLEIPSNSREAASMLRTGRSRRIDVGKVTYVDNSGVEATRYFLGVASCGLSTKVIERIKAGGPDWLPTNTPQWLGGRVSFGASLLQTAMRSASERLVLQLDDSREQQMSLVSLCIANARYFGGGMKIAPNAKLADGKFDVVTVGDISGLKIVTSSPRLYFGSHLSMSEVDHTLAKKIVVRPLDRDRRITLEIDGELPGRLPAQFQIIPDALKVRCGR